jgi:hypothetical protein
LFSWLRRRQKQAQRAEDEAATLLAANPARARSEIDQRQENDQDADVFAHWDRVLRTVAQLTGRRIGADTTPDEAAASAPEADLIERLETILGKKNSDDPKI